MPDWHRDEDGLALRVVLDGCEHLLRADFLRGSMGYRLRKGGGRGEAVARAIGLKKSATPSVLDATAGLGRDAFLFAWLGCPVIAVERQAEIHALLADALKRAEDDSEVAQRLAGRLQLIHGDSIFVLEQLASGPEAACPEVVYLDPMHPQRRSAGTVRKEMRIFRGLVGEDLDAERLLESALRVARRRVVVKRPRKGEPLGGKDPAHMMEGKSTRYDIYLTAGLGNARDSTSAVD
ncbi:MAG: class I SAM-dependent methyltransferase [Planctomycetes bacterium]|nr:class I SAM-dependent methyltransferase [Planctomycetota bacterium]